MVDGSNKSKSQKENMKHGAEKNSSKSAHKGQKVSPKSNSKRYNLRSSLDGIRVLRSMSNGKSKTPVKPVKSHSPVRPAKSSASVKSVSAPVHPTTERRKKRKRARRASTDEYSRIKKRVRYLLKRIGYEQNLIDAYSGEGWKGQSLEKIRPEKELQRAKTEILRCKLKIRDIFQHLDSLLSEGKLEESLFDTEGQISSEDIFCAKCGSKELSANNDIILCDGICDRGFHQKCLSPPLLSENIPPGDEGWLCPACDCKVDCFDLLNEYQGSELDIENKWENVFPEATATANGDDSRFSSEDSDDDDYDPDTPDADAEDQGEEHNSDDSDSTSSKSGASKHDMNCNNLGLPSDDSEDEDYDPDGPDTDERIQKKHSGSDESDFSSDSDDFCAVLVEAHGANEIPSSSKPLTSSGEGRRSSQRRPSMMNSESPALSEPDMNLENILPVSKKRQRERLDYEKLYNETYGETSSDSSDDEEWSDINEVKHGKSDALGEGSPSSTRAFEEHKTSMRVKDKLTVESRFGSSKFDQQEASPLVNEYTPVGMHLKSKASVLNGSVAEQQNDDRGHNSDDNSGAAVRRGLSREASQRLRVSLKEDQYPSRATKESLAEELGMTFQQVSKWFDNARHSMRVSGKEATREDMVTPHTCTSKEASHVGVDTAPIVLAKDFDQAVMITPIRASAIYAFVTGDSTPSEDAGWANNNSNYVGSGLANHHTSISYKGEQKKSGQAGKEKAEAKGTSSNGGRMREFLDEDRRKAIARELRKRRKSM